MKNKIKYLASTISVALITIPTVAMAQFDPSAGGGTGLSDTPITVIITNIMQWLLYIVGILGVIGFAIAGILYLTAAGDEDRMQGAKRAMIYSIIGVVVALLGLVVLRAVSSMIGGDNRF
jgi:hypothetical protein